MTVKMEVSYGEPLDKSATLQIKLEHVADPARRADIEKERVLLCAAREAALGTGADVAALSDRLKEVSGRRCSPMVEENLYREYQAPAKRNRNMVVDLKVSAVRRPIIRSGI